MGFAFALLWGLALLGATSAGAETVTFTAGPEQSFVVPAGVVEIKVVAVGETGGNGSCGGLASGCFPGSGAKVNAVLPVEHGQKLYVDFGGGGVASGFEVGAGGSAADLRTVASTEAGSLASRLIVAGGGGGGGEAEEPTLESHAGSGGNAQGTTGEDGGAGFEGGGGGGGGSLTTGGAEGAAGLGGANGGEGEFGQGGAGAGSPVGEHIAGGGGGGGYYGGGGGGSGARGGGGGGGSSFVTAAGKEASYAIDFENEPASISISYTVAAPPSVSIVTPAEGAGYNEGQSVTASFSCAEGTGGPGLKPGNEGCEGTVASGSAISTSTPGPNKFVVTARSQDGLSASETVTYTVAAPPSVSIVTPAEGARYSEGQSVTASFSCAEGTGGPGLKPGSEGCEGTVASGQHIATSTVGEHQFTVTARSTDGQVTERTVKYDVIKAKCTTDNGTVKLSPGLTDTPAVQTIKIKGTLRGCTGQPFTKVRYTATLKTAGPVACSVLKSAGETATGAAKYEWTPKAKPSRGTLSAGVSETPGVALSGEVTTGSYAPLMLSGSTTERFEGGATCGQAVGKKPAKAVKNGAFSGSAVSFE